MDFDFIDDHYLVVYFNDSVTEVYTTENSIELVHKMRLPTYERYQQFEYLMYEKERFPKRDFFEGTLIQLKVNKKTNETAFMVYKFDEP